MLWVILVMLIITWVLIYLEKNDKPEPSGVGLDNIYKEVDGIELTNWRISILIGIISTPLIVYYIESRIPTLFEWIIIGSMISMTVYLTSDWRNSEKFHQQKSILLNKILELKSNTVKSNPPSSSYQNSLNLFN